MTPLELVARLREARGKASPLPWDMDTDCDVYSSELNPPEIAETDGTHRCIMALNFRENCPDYNYILLAANSSSLLCDTVTRLVEALKWYAQAEPMQLAQDADYAEEFGLTVIVPGKRARQALKDVGVE